MPSLVLFGSGGHSKSCIEVIESTKKYKIAFLVDIKKNIKNSYYKTYLEKNFHKMNHKCKNAIIAFGAIKNLKLRQKKFLYLKKKGFKFPNIIASTSYLSKTSKINEGTIIMHGVIINNSCKIGKNCIINSKSLIEHDVVIGDNCHISTGAILNGEVKIKKNTFIGSGVIVFNNITIGENCIVSAGSIIKKDLPDNSIIR